MKATTHKFNRPGMTIESPRTPAAQAQGSKKGQQDIKKPKERAQSANPAKPASEVAVKGNNGKELDIKTAWKQVYKIGPGLQNVGNTCFLNSVLQMLTYTTPFANYLLDKTHSKTCIKKNGQFCALCAFENHVNRVFGGNQKREIQPTEILKNIKQINKKFRIGRQEDSQEFLRDLIDAFQKSAVGFVEKPAPKLLETTDISKIFGGKLKSSVECKECHHKSEIFENFFDLSLELNKNDSIQKCLDVFFKAEELKGSNKYRCSGCNKLVEASKKFSIHQRPVVLTIHLKRFDNLFMRISKINRHIQFPETLSLKSYVDEKTSEPLVYDLQGMVIHMGSGCSCGHYFSYVKNSNNSWFLMNDEDVRPSQLQNVMRQNAYLLTYVLRGPVTKTATAMTEEVPAAEPTKMVIEKPLQETVAAPEKPVKTKKDLVKAMVEKKEKLPVPIFGEKASNKKEDGKMLIEEEGETRGRSKAPENKKESLNKTMPVQRAQSLKPQEPSQEKSASEKIFEKLSQSKVTPINLSLGSLLEDDLDAPAAKRRMDAPQNLFRQLTKDIQPKEKTAMNIESVRTPSAVKDSMVIESNKQSASSKIETPLVKEDEKIPYSKQLEALLDEKEAKTYMSRLDSSVTAQKGPSPLKRSLSTGDAALKSLVRNNSITSVDSVLRKLSLVKNSVGRSFSMIAPSSTLKKSPLVKLKRMSKGAFPSATKKLKNVNGQEVSIGSSGSTEETQDSSPLKPVYKVPKTPGSSVKKSLAKGDEKGRLNKINESDEFGLGGDQELLKLKKIFEKRNSMVEELAPSNKQMSVESNKGKERGQQQFSGKKTPKMSGF